MTAAMRRWGLALVLALLAAAGCSAITDDFESSEWFVPYDQGESVAGADFCYDFYFVVCGKMDQCYPESVNSMDECAQGYYDEYCEIEIYQQGTVNGDLANDCLQDCADWTCGEYQRYASMGEIPESCQSLF